MRPQTSTSVYDVRLLFPVLFLVGIGIVMVYSASSAVALKQFGSDYYFLKRQGIFALLGIAALVIGRHFPYRYLQMLAYPLLLAGLGSLLAIYVTDLGYAAGGSSRWLRLGDISFQPSEFARFALVIYLADSLNRKADRVQEFSVGLLPHLLVLGIFCGLVLLQPDFGSAVLLCAVAWIVMFVAGVRFRHLLAVMLVLLPPAYYLMIQESYRMRRLLSFLDPWKHSADAGYQIIHSLMAFGSGGLWGAGIGKGYQKLFYLPEPHTDFIFSVIGEELGLVGVLFIIAMYALILWRGVAIARSSLDRFGALVAIGLTTTLGLQVCVNMGVAMGMLPPKGLTLPFISYGGTSLLISMASVGVLMNIGAPQTAKPKPTGPRRRGRGTQP
jgi:cell division protein FtsW